MSKTKEIVKYATGAAAGAGAGITVNQLLVKAGTNLIADEFAKSGAENIEAIVSGIPASGHVQGGFGPEDFINGDPAQGFIRKMNFAGPIYVWGIAGVAAIGGMAATPVSRVLKKFGLGEEKYKTAKTIERLVWAGVDASALYTLLDKNIHFGSFPNFVEASKDLTGSVRSVQTDYNLVLGALIAANVLFLAYMIYTKFFKPMGITKEEYRKTKNFMEGATKIART